MARQWQELGKPGRFAVVMASALFVLVIVLLVQVSLLAEYIKNGTPGTIKPDTVPVYLVKHTMSK